MKQIKTAWNSVKKVLSKKKYLIISLAIAFIFFSISILSKNFKLIINFITKLNPLEFLNLLFGLYYEGIARNEVHSSIILITISVLLGITGSIMIFKIHSNGKIKGNISKTGTFGAIMGIAVPVCVPCGIGILSILGFGSVVAFLPFQGTELGILSIILLGYAIITLGSSINECPMCQVNLAKKDK